MCREVGQNANFKKKCVLSICGVPRAIYSLGRVFRGSDPSRAVVLKASKCVDLGTPGKILIFSF